MPLDRALVGPTHTLNYEAVSCCVYYQDPSVTTSQQITPVGSRKRKRRKLKEQDLSDLLSPESPLFRAKRKSGDLLLDHTFVSPATPKGNTLYQLLYLTAFD